MREMTGLRENCKFRKWRQLMWTVLRRRIIGEENLGQSQQELRETLLQEGRYLSLLKYKWNDPLWREKLMRQGIGNLKECRSAVLEKV